MKVQLISHTPLPIKVIYLACRTCYSKAGPLSQSDVPENKMLSLIRKTILSGHHSVLEHASFTFGVEGISRVSTHQLVRHRHASYAQQSQRYVEYDAGSINFIKPKKIKNKKRYERMINSLFEFYQEMLEDGVPAEDARYILPNATPTNIMVTMNYREIMQFCNLRLCYRAQWEILDLAKAMKKEIIRISSFLGSFLEPKCQLQGYCAEDDCCGHYKFAAESVVVKKERRKKWDM
ncbi:MAG: FAD-dependent thymidylate synthase [Candidatus Margulisbacteria bacterium]|nr:FAD-dependent thymidylate synthase [Candidatus Margulisiibacteriota bacterium]